MLEQRALLSPRLGVSAAPHDYATLFEAQAARTPARPALTFESVTLTYAEVNERANRLAHLLVSRNVGAEVVVGVLLGRSLEMVLALLAVHKAGGICLPLDVSLPSARFAPMLEDSDAALVITDAGLAPRLVGTGIALLLVDQEDMTLSSTPMSNPQRDLLPSSGFQIMFTSGSTGRPKGVTLTQGGVLNFLRAMLQSPGMDEDDVILALASTSFDPAIVEIYQPLICGAHTVVVPHEVAVDGLALWARVQEVRPTILNGTPATLKMLVEAGWMPGTLEARVVCGGETMSPTLARVLLERSSSVWNVYGPTEATALCTAHRVLQPEDPVPIGRALPGVSVHVLDAFGCPVGVGEVGELHIGGAGVTRGYLKRGDLTAERFVRDPFDPDPAARLYRSGDLAAYRPDGNLVLAGRVDDQVKINGFRIEPSAIESVLLQHPSVRDAVVLVRDRQLIGYVAAHAPTACTEAELRDALATTLPQYMLPARIICLTSLPLNTNAKIDRRALLDMPLPPPDEDVRPRTPLERRLQRILTTVLGGRQPGMTEPFSALGLDSLAGVRLVREIESDLGCKLPIGVLLRATTLQQLAEALQARIEE